MCFKVVSLSRSKKFYSSSNFILTNHQKKYITITLKSFHTKVINFTCINIPLSFYTISCICFRVKSDLNMLWGLSANDYHKTALLECNALRCGGKLIYLKFTDQLQRKALNNKSKPVTKHTPPVYSNRMSFPRSKHWIICLFIIAMATLAFVWLQPHKAGKRNLSNLVSSLSVPA